MATIDVKGGLWPPRIRQGEPVEDAQANDAVGPGGDGAPGRAAALAANQIIQCESLPCFGSGNDDLIYERTGNGKDDKIYARGGHDRILANKYTNDHDIVKGGPGGFDKINVRDGDPKDRIRAGTGAHDWCIVDANSELAGGCERIN